MTKQEYGRHLSKSPGEQTGLSLSRQTGSAWPWVLVGLALVAGLAGYGYYHPAVLPSWVRDLVPVIPNLPDSRISKPLYRWRDEQGRVQITDTPPEGRSYEILVYRKDANVVPSENEADH